MAGALRREKWWLALNVLAILGFLYLASKSWLEPELQGQDVAIGGVAVVWASTALPVLLTALLANTVWFGIAVHRGLTSRDWTSLWLVVLSGATWILAAVIDQLHH
jgi:hypothetical protein